MLISKLYKERVKFFNKIVANFNNERISDLVVAYKISKIKFLKLQRHAKDYFYKSKEYSLINMTPNGRLAPKIENEKSFNNFILSYFELIKSLKITSNLKNYIPPVIRYKEEKINKKNKTNKKRSELPHADCWAGWTEDYLLFLMPLWGDVKNNKVRFFEVPKNISEQWLKKKNFVTANKRLKTKLRPLKDHYKLGYLYIADITVPHITIRNHKSKSRLSIDSPLQFKSKKIKKQNIKVTQYINSKENFISIKKAEKLKNGYHLICPYKMGEFEKTTGINSKPAFKLIRSIN
jgi:hypothetical protein